MFNVNFYTFNKKDNSTKRPTGAGTTYECILKEPSGIINPTIALNIGLINNPSALNYCYIQTFNRYYFVNEWSFDNGLWYASLQVDTMATAKDIIGDKDLYIVRSSAESDGYIKDNTYITRAFANSYIDEIGTVNVYKGGLSNILPNYFSTSLANGFYYLGVNGANGTGVTWYCMSASAFNTMIQRLYDFVPNDWGDVPAGIAKSACDPLQYVVNCYWLPDPPLGVQFDGANVQFGSYIIGLAECAKIDPVSNIQRYEAEFNIRKHPQASARGAYLNTSPYSNYQLVMQPFGNIPLDSNLMVDDTTVKCIWYVDYTTGQADLTIKATNSLIANLNAMLGVPIQLSQNTVSVLGQGIQYMANDIGGSTGSLFGAVAGQIAGGISQLVGIDPQPKPSRIGGGGNFLPFNSYRPMIYSDFFFIVDEYNTDLGRPLCKIRKPRNIAGYMQALDGSIEAPYTRAELEQINNYINSGFFYE